jgi:predicted PurR-regulated permease PerM
MSLGDAATTSPNLRGRVLKFTLIGCLAVVGLLAFEVFRPFLLDFTVAGSVALLLAPAQRRLTRMLHGRASWAASLLALVTLIMILVPIVGSVMLLARQALVFYDWVRPYLQPEALRTLWRDGLPTRLPWLSGWLGHDDAAFSQFASLALSRGLGVANNVAQATLGGLAAALSDLLVFILLLFFLLRDGGRLRAEISRISPLSDTQEQEIFDRLEKTVKAVVQAMVLVPVLQGFVALPGFALCGVPSPVLWSVMVVLAAFVPVLGSPLAWVPAVVYLYLYGSTPQWVGMLLYGLVVISGLDNIVKPLLLREAANVHPMLGFLAILGGLLSFGPLGLLVGPVILSLVLSAIRIYRMDILGVRTTSGQFPPV